jgi:hypothetical protein
MVDGRVDIRGTFFQRPVSSVVISISDNLATVTIVESDRPYDNNRYDVRVKKGLPSASGETLASDEDFYFTGAYNPYYCSSSTLYADFGELLNNVPEDLVNFHIYKASLDAQAKWLGSFRIAFGPLVGGVFNLMPEGLVRESSTSMSYAIHRWTEIEATRRLITMFLMEHSSRVGTSRQLGDYKESWTGEMLKLITTTLDELAKEKLEWEQFITPVPMGRTGVKSEYWDPSNRWHDRARTRKRGF